MYESLSLTVNDNMDIHISVKGLDDSERKISMHGAVPSGLHISYRLLLIYAPETTLSLIKSKLSELFLTEYVVFLCF
jgi:hypothetical protein